MGQFDNSVSKHKTTLEVNKLFKLDEYNKKIIINWMRIKNHLQCGTYIVNTFECSFEHYRLKDIIYTEL